MDDIVKKTTISVGIRPNNTELICRLFPNPTNGIIHIDLPTNQQIKSIRVIDLMGKQLFYKEEIQSSTYQLDLSHMARGIYYVAVATKNQVVYKKLILE
jgi:hypothetical protein